MWDLHISFFSSYLSFQGGKIFLKMVLPSSPFSVKGGTQYLISFIGICPSSDFRGCFSSVFLWNPRLASSNIFFCDVIHHLPVSPKPRNSFAFSFLVSLPSPLITRLHNAILQSSNPLSYQSKAIDFSFRYLRLSYGTPPSFWFFLDSANNQDTSCCCLKVNGQVHGRKIFRYIIFVHMSD